MAGRKHRLPLDFSETAFNELNEITEKLGFTTRAQTIKNSLGLLKWIYKQGVIESRKIEIRAVGKGGDIFEPEISFLEFLKKFNPTNHSIN